MEFITWRKPNGNTIQTNDCEATIEAATAAGWVVDGEETPVEPVDDVDARGLAWDERINTSNKSKDKNGNWKYKKGVNSEIAAPIEAELSLAAIDNAG